MRSSDDRVPILVFGVMSERRRRAYSGTNRPPDAFWGAAADGEIVHFKFRVVEVNSVCDDVPRLRERFPIVFAFRDSRDDDSVEKYL